MKKILNIFSKSQTSHTKSTLKKIKITIDHRERNSLVPSELTSLGFKTEFKQLPVADYIINNTAIERKTLSDFKSSIMNKRIMQQLLELKQYPNHFLILEGTENTNPHDSPPFLHENAFRGFLLSVITEYKVPIIFTLNEKDTAKYLSVLAKKTKSKENPIRASKILLSENEQLQFILEGFPQIGPVAAIKLLKQFKTIKNMANASESDLNSCIGKKAKAIHKLFNKKY